MTDTDALKELMKDAQERSMALDVDLLKLLMRAGFQIMPHHFVQRPTVLVTEKTWAALIAERDG